MRREQDPKRLIFKEFSNIQDHSSGEQMDEEVKLQREINNL